MYSRLCHTHLTRLLVVRDNNSSSIHIHSVQSLRDYASTSSLHILAFSLVVGAARNIVGQNSNVLHDRGSKTLIFRDNENIS